MKFTPISTFLVLSAALTLSVVRGQATTMTDDLGNIILATIVTDAAGDPSETLLVSTLTPVDEITTTSTTARATLTSTSSTSVSTDTNEGVGAPAVVATPSSICSTAGCPQKPTVYTQNGVVMTWTATTPTTPIPTWTSSGNVQPASAYITTISTAKGLKGAAGSSWGRNPFRFDSGDWTVMASVAVVGGLVGAVAVL